LSALLASFRRQVVQTPPEPEADGLSRFHCQPGAEAEPVLTGYG
jgi:hypothetical protein